MIGHVEHGRKALRLDGLAHAAQALEVSTDYLLGLTDDPTPAGQLTERAATHAIAEAAAPYAAAHARPIRMRELEAAAGTGAAVYDETEVGNLWFRADWLRDRGLNPERCDIISVRGESMEPLLPDGTKILVDRDRRRRRSGHVFVLRTEDGLVVKRLQRDGNRWRLHSEHPEWSPQPWATGNEIIGEVRWMARTL